MKKMLLLLIIFVSIPTFSQVDTILYSKYYPNQEVVASINKTRDTITLTSDKVITNISYWDYHTYKDLYNKKCNTKEIKVAVGHLPIGLYLINARVSGQRFPYTFLRAEPINPNN